MIERKSEKIKILLSTEVKAKMIKMKMKPRNKINHHQENKALLIMPTDYI